MSYVSTRAEPPAPAPPPLKRPLPVIDGLIGCGVLLVLAFIAVNIHANMTAAGMQPGFGFLWQQAGFDLSESLIPYSADDSYLHVILAGLVNTLFVSAVSLCAACVIGLAVALVSVGPSPLARLLALAYVELLRNLPKILILLVLFVVAVNGLPTLRHAIALGPVLVSNRAIYFPWLADDPRNGVWLVLSCLLVATMAWIWIRHAGRRQAATGTRPPVMPVLAAFGLAVPAGLAVLLQAPVQFTRPTLAGFTVEGGLGVSIQFCAVVATLALYHGAQIAEVLRGGIEAVPAGQVEAAAALGLARGRAIRLVVVPQVLRTVVPPLNNQFANLLKNTSISIAVGYSDLMSVSGTAINQTFRPLELMLVTMAIYLLLCLGLTGILNRWSDRVRTREGRQTR